MFKLWTQMATATVAATAALYTTMNHEQRQALEDLGWDVHRAKAKRQPYKEYREGNILVIGENVEMNDDPVRLEVHNERP